MKSKELNEILNKTRRTKNIELSVEQVKEIIKDLEELEKLKKVMGTPIQDIMKRLKILEILKPYFSGAIFPSAINFNFREEEWKSIKEWLGNGKTTFSNKI